MIELDQVDEEFWADEHGLHVVIRKDHGEAGWYVRDKDGEEGPYSDLDDAFGAANVRWGEISLAPANRLRHDIENGRTHAIGDLLLEYLAIYGTAGIDVQALVQRVFKRLEEA